MEVQPDSKGDQNASVTDIYPMEEGVHMNSKQNDCMRDQQKRGPPIFIQNTDTPEYKNARVSLVEDDVVVETKLPTKVSKVATVRDENNPTLGQAITGKQLSFR